MPIKGYTVFVYCFGGEASCVGLVTALISGKGGTGKTTLCAALAGCMAAEGKRVLCVDLDVGLRNLDLALGLGQEPVLPFTQASAGFLRLEDLPAVPEESEKTLQENPFSGKRK